MRKKTRFKSLPLDTLVVLLCLSGASFFSYLFWQDLNAFTVRGDKAEIGIISLKQNVVQRKFDDRVVWERIANGTKLYYGDTIRTSDLASASLDLLDGSVHLDLGENTMIRVGKNEHGEFLLSIDGGDIQIDSENSGSNIAVKLDDGSMVSLGAGSSLAAKSDSTSGVHNVEVKSGSAQITTESGQTATLGFGESVNVENGKEIQKNPIAMIYPPKELKLLNFSGGEMSVKFEWKADSGENVILETSRTKDFSKLESEFKTKSSFSEVKIASGTLYWRAFTEGTKDKSVEGKVSVEKILPARILSPSSGIEYKYRSSPPRIAFRWSGNSYAEHYKVLVSSTSDMKTPVFDSELSGTFMSLNSLEEGNYWWQVTPYYSQNNIGYEGASEAFSFKVIRNEQIRPPELFAPSENAQIIYKDSVSTNFIWKSELKNSSYVLSLATDPLFSSVVFSTETNDTRFVKEFMPAELKDGTYYWKVLRKSGDSDDTLPESEIRTFKVMRYIPEESQLVYSPENFTAAPSEILLQTPSDSAVIDGLSAIRQNTVFAWEKSSEKVPEYTFVLSKLQKDASFKIIQEKKTSKSNLSVNRLTEGSYKWKILASTSAGTSLDSKEFAFSVTKTPSLASPVLENPMEAFVMDANYLRNHRNIEFSWAEVNGATSYSFVLYKVEKKGKRKPVFTLKSTKASSARIKDLSILDVGDFEWSVTPYSYAKDGFLEQKGEASLGHFRIDFASPTKIEAVDPGKLFGE